jgi:hypothetical protein
MNILVTDGLQRTSVADTTLLQKGAEPVNGYPVQSRNFADWQVLNAITFQSASGLPFCKNR